jgi:hypothetical protein
MGRSVVALAGVAAFCAGALSGGVAVNVAADDPTVEVDELPPTPPASLVPVEDPSPMTNEEFIRWLCTDHGPPAPPPPPACFIPDG